MNGQGEQIRVGVDQGWASDPEPVKEFVAMATAEGFRPSLINQRLRQLLADGLHGEPVSSVAGGEP